MLELVIATLCVYTNCWDDYGTGKAVYQANCSSCHGSDPSVDGPEGPALIGSSFELLEAKVNRGTYPYWYSPQRETDYMPRFKFHEKTLKQLEIYLNGVKH